MKFVEFTREDKQRFFYSPEVCVAEMANFPNHSRLTTRMESLRVEGTPSEVVAKLQGGPEAKSPDKCDECGEALELDLSSHYGSKFHARTGNHACELSVNDEAVRLLELWDAWFPEAAISSDLRAIQADTRALLAKLKGGK